MQSLRPQWPLQPQQPLRRQCLRAALAAGALRGLAALDPGRALRVASVLGALSPRSAASAEHPARDPVAPDTLDPARADAAAPSGRCLRLRCGQSLQALLEAAEDGDTIELDPGIHRGQAALITQQRLRLCAPRGRAVLHAEGAHMHGKALLVVRGGQVHIEGVDLCGTRVPAGNGAGIRFEQGQLSLRRCGFFDNEMGLLTANTATATLDIDDCTFGAAPQHEGQLHHLLYVGRIARLRVSNSRFSGGFRGHLLKSRAAHSLIRCNALVDGEDGQASYQIDLPNGGLACVQGNVLGKSAQAQNQALLAYGAEGQPHALCALQFTHNHGLNDGPQAAAFVRHWPERLPAHSRLQIEDNLFVGAALPGSWGQPEDGNRLLPLSARAQALCAPACPPAAAACG